MRNIIKPHPYLRILFTSILALFAFAQSSLAQLPPYCAYFPNFDNGQSQGFPQAEESDITCYDNQLAKIPLTEIQRFKGVHEKLMDQMGAQLAKRLQTQAFKSILQSKDLYRGLLPNESFIPSKEVQECAREKSSAHKEHYAPGILTALESSEAKKVSPSDEEFNTFLEINLVNALKAKALFNTNKNYHKQMEFVTRSHLQRKNQCQRDYLSCKDKAGFFESTYHCKVTKDECQELSEQRRELENAYLNKKISTLYQMVQSSPLLFQNSNEGSILEPFLSARLEPSPLLEELTKEFTQDELSSLETSLASGDKDGVKSFYQDNGKKMLAVLKNPHRKKKLMSVARKQIGSHLKKLDEAALAICEGKGENLHHYPGLVRQAMESVAADANQQDWNGQVLSSKAAYCHLLRTSPLEKNGTQWASISGFAMLGVGAALQFIPIAGNAVGTGLMITGGAILSGVGLQQYFESEEKYQQDFGMQSVGYQDYKALLDSKKDRDSALAWSIADGALFFVDLHALKAMKQTKKTQFHSTALPVIKLEDPKILLNEYYKAIGKISGQALSPKELQALTNLNQYVKNPDERAKILQALQKERSACK